MSFDLYALDLDVSTSDEVLVLMEADDDSDDAPLTPKLAAFVRTLEVQFPGDTDEAFEESPWSSWPLTQPIFGGRGCAFNIRWSLAPEMGVVMHDLCLEHGLLFYDMQNETLVRPQQPIGSLDADPEPDPEPRPKKWCQRRS